VYDVYSKELTNLSLAAATGQSFRSSIAFVVSEQSQGFTDLNGDGIVSPRDVYVYDPNTNVATDVSNIIESNQLDNFIYEDNHIVFRVAEYFVGHDLNGDGDTDDYVAHVLSVVNNSPPISDPNGPYIGLENLPIFLDGSASSDSDGFIVSYEWDFDNDGEFDDATGITTMISFATSETYTVGLRVTDDAGSTNSNTAQITVITTINAIQNLLDKIHSMNLQTGLETSLVSNLDSAIKKLLDDDSNNDGATCGELGSFGNKINAQDGKKLTHEQAESFRDLISDIKSSTGC
jgi:PKD repeat protein